MIFARCFHRLLKTFAVCGLLLVSVSCSLVEERIDRTAGGPNVPVDTAVHMDLESAEQPEKITAPEMPPGPMKVTITEAILLSLENNRSLVVQRLDPSSRLLKTRKELFLIRRPTRTSPPAGWKENARQDPDLKLRISAPILSTASFPWSNISLPAQRLPWKPARK
jgi:hypothetical protein